MGRLKNAANRFKAELALYRRILKHPNTPILGKILLWLAIGYVLLPFDLIPDFIPVIGYLDDLVIVPGLVLLALWMTPDEVIMKCRQAIEKEKIEVF